MGPGLCIAGRFPGAWAAAGGWDALSSTSVARAGPCPASPLCPPSSRRGAVLRALLAELPPSQAAWAAGLRFSGRSGLQMLRRVPSQPGKEKRPAPGPRWVRWASRAGALRWAVAHRHSRQAYRRPRESWRHGPRRPLCRGPGAGGEPSGHAAGALSVGAVLKPCLVVKVL